jgi:acetyl esterase/lipase
MGYNVTLLFCVIAMGKCTSTNPSVQVERNNRLETGISMTTKTHVTTLNLVRDIGEHAAFKNFGNLLLPYDDNTPYFNTRISNIASLMPYHQAVNPDDVVNGVNHLIDDADNGKTIFYSFYSETQRKQDPEKNNTGLFFYRGEPGAPFAIICPGGGFSYVGSLHEGFPLASEISKKKLNAFVIRYRIGSEHAATEDLAAAIQFIFENAATLKVDTKNYSLWGGSAGARMVGNIAYYGINAFTSGNYPAPVTVVIAYTGQSLYDKGFPATFIIVSTDDRIASVSTVERRVRNLKNAGVIVSYERYENAGHGFGLGKGTDAEGWLLRAVHFWQSQMRR